MFDAMALSPVLTFDHSGHLPFPTALPGGSEKWPRKKMNPPRKRERFIFLRKRKSRKTAFFQRTAAICFTGTAYIGVKSQEPSRTTGGSSEEAKDEEKRHNLSAYHILDQRG
jgi:hypothetical protein